MNNDQNQGEQNPIQLIINTAIECEGMQVCAVPDITVADEAVVRLQLTGETAPEVMKLLSTFGSRLSKRNHAGNVVLEDYDPAVAEIEHEVERLSVAENERLMTMVEALLEPAHLALYNPGNDGLRDFKALAIVVPRPNGADPAIFFRHQTRPSELKSDKKVRLFSKDGVFDSIHEVTFTLDEEIDAVYLDAQFYIFRKERFHTMFGYYEGLKQFAIEAMAEIEEAVPIQNFEDFEAACTGDRMLMRRLRRTFKALSEGFDMEKVVTTIKEQKVPVEIVQVDGKDTLVFDKKKKFDFMLLLEDGFLHSEMTDNYYSVHSKRERKLP